MKNLGERTDCSRTLESALKGHHIVRLDVHLCEAHRAAACGPLTEPAPVIDDMHALAVGRNEHQLLPPLLIDHGRWDALRIERARRVELATIDAVAVAVSGQTCTAVTSGFSADFG